MRKNKPWVILLVFIMVINLFSGCGNAGDVSGGVAKFKVSEAAPVVETPDIRIAFSPYDINEETQVTIQKIEPPNLFTEELLAAEVAVSAFDIKAEGIETFTDLIEISIPYNPEIITSGDAKSNVGAMYYDEEMKEWTPVSYRLDEQNKRVIITTTHLSIYSAFTIKDQNTRSAKIIQVDSFPALPEGTSIAFQDVIEEAMSNQMTPGQKAMELGLGIAGDWMNISGATLTAITQTLYASEFAEGLGNAFNNVGLAAAFVQASYDFSTGDDKALFTNLTKNLSYFSASRWGSSALQLSFVGVYAIDYSLNKFATEAWNTRNEIWYAAYKAYYESENKRTEKQWYSKMYWIWQDTQGSKDPNLMKAKINEEIESYVQAFWSGSDAVERQAYWQSQVQKGGFTGGGGLNEELKKKISATAKAELMKTLQVPVFDRLEQAVRSKMIEDYRKELIVLKNYLNKKTNVLITENLKAGETAEYADHIVRFSPLSKDSNPANWTGKIKTDGTISTSFTALGHIQSGAPDKLLLFAPGADPDTDTPLKTISFKVSFPETKILLKDEIPTMDEITGDWGEVYMTFPDVQVTPRAAGEEPNECDITEAVAQYLRTAKLKCAFEIQKVDEVNANLVFGVVSGVNQETGEALDIEKNDPLVQTATYREGVFEATVMLDGATLPLKIQMKKNEASEIVFNSVSEMHGIDEEYHAWRLKFTLQGKK